MQPDDRVPRAGQGRLTDEEVARFTAQRFRFPGVEVQARLLPLDNVDSLIVASLLSFVIYTLAILWAFAARHQWAVWMGPVLAVPLAAIGFWPQWLERLG